MVGVDRGDVAGDSRLDVVAGERELPRGVEGHAQADPRLVLGAHRRPLHSARALDADSASTNAHVPHRARLAPLHTAGGGDYGATGAGGVSR